MITGRMKAFRAIKEPIRIGFFAFLSIATRITNMISTKVNTSLNATDDQPKFCPNEGTQSKRLKNTMTKKEPTKSKFFKVFLT